MPVCKCPMKHITIINKYKLVQNVLKQEMMMNLTQMMTLATLLEKVILVLIKWWNVPNHISNIFVSFLFIYWSKWNRQIELSFINCQCKPGFDGDGCYCYQLEGSFLTQSNAMRTLIVFMTHEFPCITGFERNFSKYI